MLHGRALRGEGDMWKNKVVLAAAEAAAGENGRLTQHSVEVMNGHVGETREPATGSDRLVEPSLATLRKEHQASRESEPLPL